MSIEGLIGFDLVVDVINVSGHRLSTAEIESALITHRGVAETAVIGTADELTGQAVYAVRLPPCPNQEDSHLSFRSCSSS